MQRLKQMLLTQPKGTIRQRPCFPPLLLSTIALLGAFAPAAFGEVEFTSRRGNLTVQYNDTACKPNTPSGSYRVRNSVSGQLVWLKCSDNIGDDSIHHRFTDTAGYERCYGVMSQFWGGRGTATVWTIQGAVPGYTCAQVGQTFDIEMRPDI